MKTKREDIRNIAIIAHVDHCLLYTSYFSAHLAAAVCALPDIS